MTLAATDRTVAGEPNSIGVADAEPSSTPSTSSAMGARDRQWVAAAIVTLVLAIVPAVLWPGAISWMCDEPLLVGQAWHYNAMHQLAGRGLAGTVSVPYGPLPTQLYQLFLLFSNNLPLLVGLRAALCSGVLAGSLLWLSKTLGLTPWFAAALVLSPYLWWTQRVLWDASFALPLGVLGTAAYASFLATRSGRSLLIAVAAITMVPLIHLQGLPLFVGFMGHALWRHRDSLRRHSVGLGVVMLGLGILNGRYIYLIVCVFAPRMAQIICRG